MACREWIKRLKRSFHPGARADLTQPATTSIDTRERLLEAAGEVMAELGVRGATVRKICQRAGANVAAVNYHFGDKEGLHRAVVRHAFQAAHQRHPVPPIDPDAPVEAALRPVIASLLARLFSVGQSWHGRVIARELVDPSAALDEVVEGFIRPLVTRLEGLLARACPSLGAEERRLHVLTLVGQCVFFRHARPVLDVLYGAEAYAGPDAVAALTDHILDVFLRGLPLAHFPQPAESGGQER